MADDTITADNFAYVAKLMRDECGLVLEAGKEYLVRSRLMPLAAKRSLQGVDHLIDRLRAGGTNGLLAEVVQAMVTTETLFFRDVHPFDTLRKSVLPELIERRRERRELNIWCAASSSGQEPYSIAMLIREHFPALGDWRINFTATDISHEMLERSRSGRYSQMEVNRGLPTHLLLKWFRQEGTYWHIDPRLRQAVVFSQMNLTQPWPPMPTWDVVFLRNVMIYFDNETKQSILERVSRVLSPDGYLLLGGAETTLNLSSSFQRIEHLKSGFYQRKLRSASQRPFG